ncbi:hypothetical protein EXS71_03405 [Candidatus Uhrbacteria bacterium]|nr:hypothetical protein [Candidatus Uhrbacteria bacterium]
MMLSLHPTTTWLYIFNSVRILAYPNKKLLERGVFYYDGLLMPSFLLPTELQPVLQDFFGKKKIKTKILRGGLLNQNEWLSVDGEKYVLKIYRLEMTEEKVKETHRLMKFVANHDIPVSLPIKTVMSDGYVIALYPFISGEHPLRYKNTHIRMHKMGMMLGKIHSMLDTFSFKGKKPVYKKLCSWRADYALDRIRGFRQALFDHPASFRKELTKILDVHEQTILQQNWSMKGFDHLPIRLNEGDFHTKNILMHGSQITAVLDWEKAEWGFRGFEVMRSTIFNCRKSATELSWPHIKSYLQGYKIFGRLNDLERELAFECGYRNMVFSFWAIEQYLLGDKRFRDHIIRRISSIKTLTKHRTEYAKRIPELLR